jgi:hypothetical protein
MQEGAHEMQEGGGGGGGGRTNHHLHLSHTMNQVLLLSLLALLAQKSTNTDSSGAAA